MDVTSCQKIEPSTFPSCLTPFFPWFQNTYWKKVSLTAFRKILSKVLSVVHIFSFIITTYLKKFTVIKSLSTKKCPAELSPWITPQLPPFYQKCITSFNFACSPHHVWMVLPVPLQMGERAGQYIQIYHANFD